jgi:hypothetical protein
VRRKDFQYRQRIGDQWGLVEHVRYTCARFNVDSLLIENAASGIVVAQELQRLYGRDGWAVHLVKPKGDKVARAHAVVATGFQQPIFSASFAAAGGDIGLSMTPTTAVSRSCRSAALLTWIEPGMAWPILENSQVNQ